MWLHVVGSDRVANGGLFGRDVVRRGVALKGSRKVGWKTRRSSEGREERSRDHMSR